MSVISMSYGIIIRMFYFDPDKHQAPHIHLQYGEQSAVIGLPEGDVLGGEFKSSKMKLVQAWLEIHRDELMADWRLAVEGPPIRV